MHCQPLHWGLLLHPVRGESSISKQNASQVWEGASPGMMIQMLYLRPLQHKPTTASDSRERSECTTPVGSTGVRDPIFLSPVVNCDEKLPWDLVIRSARPYAGQFAMLTIVVLGASGDLAKKKTFPALYTLFERG